MNVYDFVALLFIAMLATVCYRRGLMRGAVRMAGFLLAIPVALRLEAPLADTAAGLLHLPTAATELPTFAAILIASGVAVHAVTERLARVLPDTRGALLLDRLGGLVLGALVALPPIWLATGLLLLAPPSAAALPRVARESSTARVLAAWTPAWPQAVLGLVGEVAVGPKEGAALYRLQRLLAGGAAVPLPAEEAQMLSLLNEARRQKGLAPLRLDPRLRLAARAHSIDMVKRDYFAHESPRFGSPTDRMIDAGARAPYSGENIALNLDATQAQAALMQSPSHRANILDPYFTHVGIGAVRDGLMVMFTQDFAGG